MYSISARLPKSRNKYLHQQGKSEQCSADLNQMELTELLQSDREITWVHIEEIRDSNNVQSSGTLVDSYRASEG